MDWLRTLLGPAITLVITLVTVTVWMSSMAKDVEALKANSGDHDVVVRMGVDIDYIKKSLDRIESAVGAKEARTGR